MADYLYAEDGKIHTRFTELMRCTPGQIERVVNERLGLSNRFQSETLDFGSDRHDMWAAESRVSKELPEIFGLFWPVSHIEEEFAAEVLPGIVVHSRPDAVCADIHALIDYKTLIADSPALGELTAVQRYRKSKQLPTYAYQLGLNGIRIKKIAYLVEIWNRAQDEILGYKVIEKDFSMRDITPILPWIKDRVAMLAAEIEARS